MYTAGVCRSGLSTFYSGPRRVYFLSLGEDVALGGRLNITTCGATRNNTVLYAGLGCPKWDTPFQCQKGNGDAGDDATQQPCGSNPKASTVTISSVTSRSYFIQLGGYLGTPVVSGLSWGYDAGSVSASYSRSGSASPRPPSRSHTGTASGTGSRTRSRSRSRSAAPGAGSASRSATVSPSRSCSGSRTRKAKV